MTSSKQDNGQQFFLNKLDEFRKRSVNKDNYQQFIRDVDNIIAEADSRIEEMRHEVNRKQNEKQRIINAIGEQELESFRNGSAGGYHYDVREIRELDEEIAEKRQDIIDRAMVRGDLHYVKEQKIAPILESLDAQQIRTQVYKQLNELTDKRIETVEERIISMLRTLDSKVDSNQRDMTRQIRDVREAARREAGHNQQELLEFMEKMIRLVDGEDVDRGELKQHASNLKGGEEIDDVDLDLNRGSEDEDEGGEEEPGIEPIEEEESNGAGDRIKTTKELVEEELRKKENGESDMTQSDIAEEYGVSEGRVSQIKSGMDEL